ncbi:MAG: cystathionine gamma-synthase [Thermomicrobiales bacterium]|nr:cystathionine gamma-synthase [Thermomicrobiales bacterium]
MTTNWNDTAFETRAIHAGQDPDPATGAIITPIYQTSTFVQQAVGEHQGYDYARTANPTRQALQEALASLEGGAWGLAYASGMAATQNVHYLLNPGDHILLTDDAYGGTHRFISRVWSRYGIDYSLVDMTDLDNVRAALRTNTRLVWAETPSNPYLKVIDIKGIADTLRDHPAKFMVDNTFASPYLQNPLALGADLVLHSTTKYIGGHSDTVGGAVIGNDPEVFATMKFHQNAAGAVPGPFDVWLALRGIKTMAVRMERHSENAQAVAEFLAGHPAVERVFYPGLADHPGHDVAKRQMRGYSGMVSFTVKGDVNTALEVARGTRIFQLAESLGGVESLIEHPGQMTHASVAGTGAEVEDTLIRLSVGIENRDDLLQDLEQALKVAAPATAAAAR